jgi:hypothetical protein
VRWLRGPPPVMSSLIGVRSRVSFLTKEVENHSGEVVRRFDVISAATVMTAFIGGLFLVFFLAAFLPWLLSKGMTAAVEGMMDQIGFGSFHATTIWSWLIVLAMFSLFTVFIVAIATAILALYNLLSEQTGMGMRVESAPPELLPGPRSDAAIAASTDASFDELYAEAQRRNIRGRSSMSKNELRTALRHPQRRSSH